MKRYKVTTRFRDKKGRELFERTTFDGEAEDAKCALVEAHAAMLPLVAADPRVDMLSSTVTGNGESISTTDYADEIGSGVSGSGLMHEVTPDQLDQREVDVFVDGLPTPEGGEMKEAAGAGGGASAGPAGTFPGSAGEGGAGSGRAHDPQRGAHAGQPDGPLAGHGGLVRPLGADRADEAGAGAVPGSASHGAHVPVRRGVHAGRAGAHGGDRPWHSRSYHGKDLIGDLIRAGEEFEHTSGRQVDHIRVSGDVWRQLAGEIEKEGGPAQKQLTGKAWLAGIPIVQHDDPNSPGIQVVPKSRAGFARGGLVPKGRVFGHECKHIFIDEAPALDEQTIKQALDSFGAKYDRYILGKFPEDDKGA